MAQVRHLDSIMKNFAATCSIVVSTAVSIPLFGFSVDMDFTVGAFGKRSQEPDMSQEKSRGGSPTLRRPSLAGLKRLSLNHPPPSRLSDPPPPHPGSLVVAMSILLYTEKDVVDPPPLRAARGATLGPVPLESVSAERQAV